MEALLSQGQSTVIIGLTGDLEADAPAQALASNLSSDRSLLDENSIQRCRKFVGLLSITYTLSYER